MGGGGRPTEEASEHWGRFKARESPVAEARGRGFNSNSTGAAGWAATARLPSMIGVSSMGCTDTVDRWRIVRSTNLRGNQGSGQLKPVKCEVYMVHYNTYLLNHNLVKRPTCIRTGFSCGLEEQLKIPGIRIY